MSFKYPPLNRQEYFQLTQFGSPELSKLSYKEIKAQERDRGEVFFRKIQVSQPLFSRIIAYLEKEKIRTRLPAPDSFREGEFSNSFSVYTLNFSCHAVRGKNGGWFVISAGGRQPILTREFIANGPKRKSGARKGRYRRNLSQTEEAQVEWLDLRTPSFEKLCEWIFRKYRSDLTKIDFGYSGDELTF